VATWLNVNLEDGWILLSRQFHIRIHKGLVFVYVIEYGFQLHPDSFPVDCFLAKTIYQPENESGCIYFFSTASQVFGKDIPFHWPSSARANGKEGVVLWKGPSTERKARKGHDTKRSDWRDPSRLEPVRPHNNHHTTTRSHRTENATFPPTDYFKEPQ
jgi:hypothetical protein